MSFLQSHHSLKCAVFNYWILKKKELINPENGFSLFFTVCLFWSINKSRGHIKVKIMSANIDRTPFNTPLDQFLTVSLPIDLEKWPTKIDQVDNFVRQNISALSEPMKAKINSFCTVLLFQTALFSPAACAE